MDPGPAPQVCGYLPFGTNLVEPRQVCSAVLRGKLKFPSAYKDGMGLSENTPESKAYPLVMTNSLLLKIAHLVRWFTYEKWALSIAMLFTRG